jgi:hypothetical protein
MPITYAVAAQEYFKAREGYEKIILLLSSMAIPEPEIGIIKSALRASVRARFRAISNRLAETPKYATDLACKSGNDIKIEIEHAVPLNLIHNQVLGITRQGNRDETSFKKYRSVKEIEHFLKEFVIGVLITELEHKKINKRYAQSMPENTLWDSKKTMARYDANKNYKGTLYHDVHNCQSCKEKLQSKLIVV